MKLNILLFLLMLVVVPLAGELNIHPFSNTFRLSFGTPVFFSFCYLFVIFRPLYRDCLLA